MTTLRLLSREVLRVAVAPGSWIVAALFLGLAGFFLHTRLVFFTEYGLGENILGHFWQALLAGAPYSWSLLLLLVVPLFTMRSFAEEQRLGTLEFLLSHPIRDRSLVAAKFLAVVLVAVLLLLGTVPAVALLSGLTPLPPGPVLLGYAGLLFLAVSFAALGLFVSSLTDSQVTAGVVTLALLLSLWALTWNEAATSPPVLRVLRQVSMFDHFEGFARGAVDLDDLGYFILFAGFWLFATGRILASRHERLPRQGTTLLPPLLSHRLRGAVHVTGVLASAILAQTLLADTSIRLDLTPERRFSLAPHTREVLASLERPVRITAFLRSGDARNDDWIDLLERSRRVTGQLSFRIVDLNRSPGLAQAAGVNAAGTLVVESEGRREIFANPDETGLLGALQRVTGQRPAGVGFLPEGPGSGSGRIGAQARRTLTEAGFRVHELSRAKVNSRIPDDTAVLVVGPDADDDSAVPAILAHLHGGGGVVVLREPAASVPSGWLIPFGIEVGELAVRDPGNRLLAGDSLSFAIAEWAPDHVVTQPLARPPVFSGALAVAALPARHPEATSLPLLRTGPSSFERPLQDLSTAELGPWSAKGSRTVGVAAEIGAGRLLVLGDADFASDALLDTLGNRDLWVNAIQWAAAARGSYAARPERRPFGTRQLFLTAEAGRRLFGLVVLLPPSLFVGVAGLVVAVRRRRDRQAVEGWARRYGDRI